MKHAAIKLFGCILLAAQAGLTYGQQLGATGYKTEIYYDLEDENAALVSFDWDTNGNLYYSTGSPFWDLGFGVYRFDGTTSQCLYYDTNCFAGSRVTAIGDMIYFNDGGNYNVFDFNYFRYNPASAEAPTNLFVSTNLWGLDTRNENDFWASGGANGSIYYSELDADGDLINTPPINLGTIGNASGPLAFNAAGDLYYAEGYNTAGSTVYRWSAAEVAAAIADPNRAPLRPSGHSFAVLQTGDGSTGLQIDPEGHVLITATSFAAPSELQRLLMLNGAYVGYEVVARSNSRFETLRMLNDKIYLNTGRAIFTIEADKTLRLIAQAGQDGPVTLIGLNDEDQNLRLANIFGGAPGWVVRDINEDRLLAQAGHGGAVAIAELDDAGMPTNIIVVADSAPGWTARSLDGNCILAQAGDGGMVGIQELDRSYQPSKFTVVCGAIPGWIARSLDGNRILAQAGDGGAVIVAKLNERHQITGYKVIADTVPGWIARKMNENLLLAQAGHGGMTIVMQLDDQYNMVGPRLVFNAAPGLALVGLEIIIYGAD